MPFPQPNSHRIDLQDAAALTLRFRESSPLGGIIGGLFNAEDIRAILDQPDCAGLRYYYGISAANLPVLVLVGVTSDNEDLYNGVLAEISVTCPDYCSSDNPLNSGT